MAVVSGLYVFDLPLDDLIDEVYERIGGDPATGRSAETTRRSLNLLLLDLQNRGIPLSLLEEVDVTVSVSTTSYTLDDKYPDVLYGVVERDGIELPLTRMSLFDYKAIPNKSTLGRPLQYTVERNRDDVTVKVWPMPENSTDVLKFWAYSRPDDVNKQDQLVNLPVQYLPAITAGLTYYVAQKRIPEKFEVLNRLKSEYIESLQLVLDNERERSSMYAVPSLRRP